MTALRQYGGTVIGFLGGLILGLLVAVVVAVYVTRAPVPFVNKQPRPSDRVIEPPRSGAEAPDPNKSAQVTRPKPGGTESSAILNVFTGNQAGQTAGAPAPGSTAPAAGTAAPGPAPGNQAPVEARTQPQQQANNAAGRNVAAPAEPPKTMTDIPTSGDKSVYFLQAGSFAQQVEADAMKAKLALAGFEARVQTADINGQKVFRVRVGPFNQFDEMNTARSKMSENGVTVAVIRQK